MRLRWLQRRPWIATGLVVTCALVLIALVLALADACAPDPSGNRAPDWILLYPEAQPTVLVTEQRGGERSGTLTFTSEDPAKDVLVFYRDRLREAGWEVSSTPFLRPDDVRGGQVTAESPDNKRGLHVMVNVLEDDRSEAILNYSEIP